MKFFTKFLFLFLFLFLQMQYSQSYSSKDLMKMSLAELLNVELTTAGKKPEELKKIPASVVLITRNEIKVHGFQTLSEILENVPGMYMIDDYFWTGGVNFGMRGFYATSVFNNMIILVNGINQRADYYDDFNLSKVNVPVEAIDRIEVIRGPMSIIYGSGAFFGAINIITNSLEEFQKEGYLQASFGSGDAKKIFFRKSGKSGDFEFSVNTAFYSDNKISQPISKMISDTLSLPYLGFINDKDFTFKLSKKKFYANISSSYKDFTFDFSNSYSKWNIVDGIPSALDGDFSKTVANNFSLGYRKNLWKGIKLNGKFSYLTYDQINEYDTPNSLTPNIENSYGFSQQYTKSFELEANIFIDLSENNNLTIGFLNHTITELQTTINLPIYNYDNILYALPEGEFISNSAFFAQIDWAITDRLRAVAGLRGERLNKYTLSITDFSNRGNARYITSTYDNDKINFVPRLAFIYECSDKTIAKLLYGEAIRHPSYGENNEVLKVFWRKNEQLKSLKPAKIATMEINLLHSFNKNFITNISLFSNSLRNLITRDNYIDANGDLQWAISNAGKMKTYGFEIGLEVQPIKNLDLDCSFTYQKTSSKKEELSEIKVGYAPQFLAYINADYKCFENFICGIDARFVDEMETKWDPEKAKTNKRIGLKVPAYLIVGLNFRIENLFAQHVSASLRLTNLFNAEIRYPTTGNSQWAEKGTLGFGREFFFSLGYEF